MTVRRTRPNRKSPPGVSDESSKDPDHQSLVNQRAALILITAVLTGVAAGILSRLSQANPAEAVLTGGAAFAAAITLLNTLIG
jgi:hypothetical protein